MDAEMMDVSYDVDIDVGARPDNSAQPAVQPVTEPATGDDRPVPAAYFESLDDIPKKHDPWPETLNLHGVDNFDPNDPLYYAMEHCPPQLRVKQTRWINDSSVNLEYYTADDATHALAALTHPDAGDPASLSADTPRRARGWTKNPEAILTIRMANSGDQKQRGAANRSGYYRQNPSVRGGGREREREREPKRRARRSPEPRPVILDYDGAPPADPQRRDFDERMSYDSGPDSRRGRRNGDRDRSDRNDRDRGDRGSRRIEVDSYRPGSRSPESRYGRLRNRSASPGGYEGDGRLGFDEDGTSMRRRYRSRSRSRSDRRRQAAPSGKWIHDRASYGERGYGSSREVNEQRASFSSSNRNDSEMITKHRRSDATDETASARKGSLLSRMTKDGQPLSKPSLASRITRDDDDESTFGRLKNDFSMPRDDNDFEPVRKRDLASRITRDDTDDDDNGINIRGRSDQGPGFNIRGSASKNGDINIRGVAASRY